MSDIKRWIGQYLAGVQKTFAALPQDTLATIIDVVRAAHREDRQIFVFGNGGSAATAQHFICDMGKGASDKIGKRFRCMSLNDNVAWMTAIGNDYAYEDVFVRQLENFARPGDVVMTMSVSGSSPNLVKAFEWANGHGLTTIAIVGGKRGTLATLAEHVVVIDSQHYGHVEDAHMCVAHILAYAFMEHPELAR
jgi:D-sedoheptulose 7-phosphate isomerase